MNIIMYNFDNVDAEELSEFSDKVDSSIYFALSLSEVSVLLASNKMEIAILKIMEKIFLPQRAPMIHRQ